ncbi:MAG: cellulase family glycosylhydrolase [Pseudomonadota bacterium]
MANLRNLRVGLVATLFTAALAGCGGSNTDPSEVAIPRSPIERCVTIADALEAGPVPGTWTQSVTQTDFQSIASAGFDTVRITVPMADFTGQEAPFTVDIAALERLETVADWALGSNLTLVVTLSDFDALAGDFDAQKGRMNRIWLQVADHLKAVPGPIVYDLLDSPDPAIDPAALQTLNTVIVDQLRGAEERRWIILPAGNGNSLDALEKTDTATAGRTILKFDYADPVSFTRPDGARAAEAEWGTMEEFRAVIADFNRAEAVRERTRRPVLLGSFAVDSGVPVVMRARWVRALRQSAERRDMGWCYAAFGGDEGVFNLETGAWSPELIDAVFRDGDRLN